MDKLAENTGSELPATNVPTANRAAIYVSDALYSEEISPNEDRTGLCRAEAASRDLPVVRVFYHPRSQRISNGQGNGLKAMLQAAARREFKILIVPDADHLGRRTSSILVVQDVLHNLNIQVTNATKHQSLNLTPSAEDHIRRVMAESIKEAMRIGLREAAAKHVIRHA